MTAVVILGCGVALGTALAGWWAVPALGMLYGLWRGPARVGTAAAAGALLGWSLLTAWNWLSGPATQLAASVGAVLGLPAWALLLATVLFPAWLCGCAAAAGAALRGRPFERARQGETARRVRSS